jgi:4-diphosphocytidyl-2-C-methyl-D-erythritol kinase
MIVFPNAKINIGLFVTEKRNDGYHSIESIFYPIPVCDVLEFQETENSTTLKLHGNVPECKMEDNLVYKAYKLLKDEFSIPKIEISLLKNIPAGAGLGGGSADASFMLCALNEYFKLELTIKELESFALKLGSDCPFFIENNAKFVSGRGEIFENSQLDLSGYYFVLINPEIHISTKEAYEGIKPAVASHDLRNIHITPITEWKRLVRNQFEEHLLEQHIEIKKLKDNLYDIGAVYASMTGSGSSVYGIFEEEPEKPELPANYATWVGKWE